MALGQYDLALETFNEMESSPSVEARINSIKSIDDRQQNSIFYRVRTVEVETEVLTALELRAQRYLIE